MPVRFSLDMESALLVYGSFLLGSSFFSPLPFLGKDDFCLVRRPHILWEASYFKFLFLCCCWYKSLQFFLTFSRENLEAEKRARNSAPAVVDVSLRSKYRGVLGSLFSPSLAKAVAFLNTTEQSYRHTASIGGTLFRQAFPSVQYRRGLCRDKLEDRMLKREWWSWHESSGYSTEEQRALSAGDEKKKKKSVMVFWSLECWQAAFSSVGLVGVLLEVLLPVFFFFFTSIILLNGLRPTWFDPFVRDYCLPHLCWHGLELFGKHFLALGVFQVCYLLRAYRLPWRSPGSVTAEKKD